MILKMQIIKVPNFHSLCKNVVTIGCNEEVGAVVTKDLLSQMRMPLGRRDGLFTACTYPVPKLPCLICIM